MVFDKRRYSDDYGKVVNIINHEGKADKNPHETSRHIHQNGQYFKTKNKCWQGYRSLRAPLGCWCGVNWYNYVGKLFSNVS